MTEISENKRELVSMRGKYMAVRIIVNGIILEQMKDFK
jgi:hypothetical protein